MPKVKYNDITFDSELEVEYYKYLKEEHDKGVVLDFIYHPKHPIQITKNNSYTPDFCVVYADRIEIVETKGYSQYSYMKDNMIHNIMLQKSEDELREWVLTNRAGLYVLDTMYFKNPNRKVIYRKVKYLKAYGFVDWDFKNPNTIANKRKEKINDLSTEIKALRDFKKDAERYFRYHIKVVQNEKLTKPQKEWYYNYVKKLREEYGSSNETN